LNDSIASLNHSFALSSSIAQHPPHPDITLLPLPHTDNTVALTSVDLQDERERQLNLRAERYLQSKRHRASLRSSSSSPSSSSLSSSSLPSLTMTKFSSSGIESSVSTALTIAGRHAAHQALSHWHQLARRHRLQRRYARIADRHRVRTLFVSWWQLALLAMVRRQQTRDEKVKLK
jgi:hypothetical protein